MLIQSTLPRLKSTQNPCLTKSNDAQKSSQIEPLDTVFSPRSSALFGGLKGAIPVIGFVTNLTDGHSAMYTDGGHLRADSETRYIGTMGAITNLMGTLSTVSSLNGFGLPLGYGLGLLGISAASNAYSEYVAAGP